MSAWDDGAQRAGGVVKRPSLTVRNTAWHAKYAGRSERHAEFSTGIGGGLITITERDDDTVSVEVHNADANVYVVGQRKAGL